MPNNKRRPHDSDAVSVNEQINEILDYFGKSHTDGNVAGNHNTSILAYLIRRKSERYSKTLSKLAYKCGIGQRYVKENYLQGMEDWGLIHVDFAGDEKIWTWRGIKGIDEKGN